MSILFEYFSQRLREMSESIKQTYGDDRLIQSPNHIGIIPLSHIHSHSEDSYGNNLKSDETKMSTVMMNKKDNGQSIESTNMEDMNKSSNLCDMTANQETAKPIDDSNTETKSKPIEKNKHLQGENQGYSVTIPRVQKSHQSHTRKQNKLNSSCASDALSRSYQHPNTLQISNESPNSSFDRSGVSMRRSSSVPCKRITVERGSTSSSDDSGFSPGSPNTTAMMTGFSLEQAVQNMHLNTNPSKVTNHVPNQEAQTAKETDDASNMPSTSS